MSEGFRFMPLGSAHGLVRCKLGHRCLRACAGGADASLRDVTIAQMGNGASKCEWRHAPKARGGFWEFWRKSVELRNGHRTRRIDFRLLTEARRICALRAPHEMGGRWKSQNRKNVYFSPYVEEPLNSKVIKSFVPELSSRVSCFLCFIFMDIRCTFRT